ncbi:Crp/Fnr family transcriptional regulator [Flavicella sp.]|nr:Crp/Fnr family transcriptional regulator [Flavicella sp.]MDA9111664.1 Crp/Fnr family transcriptional regulator [Flavicella sp.]
MSFWKTERIQWRFQYLCLDTSCWVVTKRMTGTKPLTDYIQQYIALTDEETSFLTSKIHLKKYRKGDTLLHQGDICKTHYFILSGVTKTFYLNKAGAEHILTFCIENWWAADLGSLISQTPAAYNIQCLENTSMLEIPLDAMENLYLKIPKLERFFRKIVERAYVATQNRIRGAVSLSAKEQYTAFQKRYPQLEQRIPQYMVASYLGIQPQSLSRIRKEIEA